jgi:uncharacterized protein (TIGR03435 family)
MRLMVQALLADRFRLKLQRQMKEMMVYAVVVAKNGLKLAKSKIDEKDCLQTGVRCHAFSTGGPPSGVHGDAADISDLAHFIANWTDKPVVDQTGLQGLYKIDTDGWVPISLGQTPGANEGVPEPDRPSLFAVFERLGLKLETRKVPVEMFAIESIERPSEN